MIVKADKHISLDRSRLPRHIAIIMDGNGRWSKLRGKPRTFGHKNGVKSVKDIIKTSANLGIEYLTLYAFSTENWKRPKAEIKVLIDLLSSSIDNEFDKLHENNIRINVIGCLAKFPKNLQEKIERIVNTTMNNTKMTLTVALGYGSHDEIKNAMASIAEKVKNNIIDIDSIDKSTIKEHLYTHNLPDVDLLIRTSGEYRLSNFLLWQIAYAELYFTDTLWPDFNGDSLEKALVDYQNRERRFGKINTNPLEKSNV